MSHWQRGKRDSDQVACHHESDTNWHFSPKWYRIRNQVAFKDSPESEQSQRLEVRHIIRNLLRLIETQPTTRVSLGNEEKQDSGHMCHREEAPTGIHSNLN